MPPRPVFIALYREGTTDDHFLPGIIRRTLERLVAGREQSAVDIQEITVINHLINDTGPYMGRVLRAAQEAARKFAVLIIHRDADSRTRDNAKRRYFDPICEAVQNCSEPVCNKLVPIIPVRCIEAWMLADPSAFQSVTASNTPVTQLGLPDQPRHVEVVQKPKQVLEQAVSAAYGHRRRNNMDIETLYGRLANKIDLARLDQVPSYHDFVSDMDHMLVNLGIIHRTGKT